MATVMTGSCFLLLCFRLFFSQQQNFKAHVFAPVQVDRDPWTTENISNIFQDNQSTLLTMIFKCFVWIPTFSYFRWIVPCGKQKKLFLWSKMPPGSNNCFIFTIIQQNLWILTIFQDVKPNFKLSTKFQNVNQIWEFQPNCNVSSVISGLNISVKK